MTADDVAQEIARCEALEATPIVRMDINASIARANLAVRENDEQAMTSALDELKQY